MISAIELKGVGKTYIQNEKRIVALRNFSLDVPAGSFVSVMGPSGCGKSTLTKIVAGIENAQEGTLRVLGTDCPEGVPSRLKERIGYVFQWHNLTEWRTVEGNLFFPLEMFGRKKDATWKARSEKYLNMVGLYEYRSVYPRELSGGMKQRVGIARALMTEPDLLVFDQPFGALDAITRKQLAASFADVARLERKTVLMVTSDLDEAIRCSDKICVMNAFGEIEETVDANIAREERRRPDFWQQDSFLNLKRRLVGVVAGVARLQGSDAQ